MQIKSFFQIFKKKNISAQDIFCHYLKENDNDRPNRRKNIHKLNKFSGSYDYCHVICPRLKNIYGNSPSFMNRINEIKKNHFIAYKKDFNIKDYQDTLLKLMDKKICDKYLNNLRDKYVAFNEKNYGMVIPRGRYINLAYKLKGHLSGDVYDNLIKKDKNYKLYFERKKKCNE
jgi:hypothetical protein